MTADGQKLECEAALAGWLWRIDLALSGSRGQSVEAVGNAMQVYVCVYKAEVTGRAGHGREVSGMRW